MNSELEYSSWKHRTEASKPRIEATKPRAEATQTKEKEKD